MLLAPVFLDVGGFLQGNLFFLNFRYDDSGLAVLASYDFRLLNIVAELYLGITDWAF